MTEDELKEKMKGNDELQKLLKSFEGKTISCEKPNFNVTPFLLGGEATGNIPPFKRHYIRRIKK